MFLYIYSHNSYYLFIASFIYFANKSDAAVDVYLSVRLEWVKTGDSDSRVSKWKIRTPTM